MLHRINGKDGSNKRILFFQTDIVPFFLVVLAYSDSAFFTDLREEPLLLRKSLRKLTTRCLSASNLLPLKLSQRSDLYVLNKMLIWEPGILVHVIIKDIFSPCVCYVLSLIFQLIETAQYRLFGKAGIGLTINLI